MEGGGRNGNQQVGRLFCFARLSIGWHCVSQSWRVWRLIYRRLSVFIQQAIELGEAWIIGSYEFGQYNGDICRAFLVVEVIIASRGNAAGSKRASSGGLVVLFFDKSDLCYC